MKSWFASSIWIISVAQASVEDGLECLNRLDIACAEQHAADAIAEDPEIWSHKLLAGQVAFYQGNYQEASSLISSIDDAPPNMQEGVDQIADLYKATVEATSDFNEKSQNGVIVRWSPGVDEILVDEAISTLTAARIVLKEEFDIPEQPALIEIYPTARKFILASGLSADAVSTTGVVAISKWSRLLVTSPNALARGYSWKDTVVHEYVHELVSRSSLEKTPVWLHEGIAKNLETWWRGKKNVPLKPWDQTILAEALAKNDLVTLEEMSPSIAFLPSAEKAALAYTEVRSLVWEAIEKGGPGTIKRLMVLLKKGEDPKEALAEVGGFNSFEELNEKSLQELRSLNLVQKKLASSGPILFGEQDQIDADPVLSKDQSLADLTRLGDLLMEADKPEAAMIEYQKANPKDEPPSPLLSNKIANCYIKLGKEDKALETLRLSVLDYPETAVSWLNIGKILEKKGDIPSAINAFKASADINPFKIELQGALKRLYLKVGDSNSSQTHEKRLEILLFGGTPI